MKKNQIHCHCEERSDVANSPPAMSNRKKLLTDFAFGRVFDIFCSKKWVKITTRKLKITSRKVLSFILVGNPKGRHRPCRLWTRKTPKREALEPDRESLEPEKEAQKPDRESRKPDREGLYDIVLGQRSREQGQTSVRENQTLIRKGQTSVRENQTLIRKGQILEGEAQTSAKEGQDGVVVAPGAAKKGINAVTDNELREKP